jgi:hypothetical protein
MAKVWKIAPGQGAEMWDECRDNDCIVLGWKKLKNYRPFGRNKAKIVGKLGGGPGNGKGAATSIIRFVHDIGEFDVLVANDGRSRVEGIGIVTSDYLPPGSLRYPRKGSRYPHSRKVEWIITKAVDLGHPLFGRDTVTALRADQVNRIRAAYKNKKEHRHLTKTLDQLFSRVLIDDKGFIDSQEILMDSTRELKAEGAFDPKNLRDGTEKAQRSIVLRQGRAGFRRKLFRAYEGRCAITGCKVKDLLEAAHIKPYMGPKTNHSTNGLLLRADLHTLFDLHLIAIDANYCVRISPLLQGSEYERLDRKKIRLPDSPASRPNREVLKEHRMQLRGAE